MSIRKKWLSQAAVMLGIAAVVMVGRTDVQAANVQEVKTARQLVQRMSSYWDPSCAAETVINTGNGTVTQNGRNVEFEDAFEVSEDEQTPNLYSSYAVQSYFEDHPADVSEVRGNKITVVDPYQTKQIILHSSALGDTCGASEVLHYADADTYYLRYDTEEDTKTAYEKLHDRYGENCVLDQVLQADDSLLTVSGGKTVTWGAAYMGLDVLKYAPTVTNIGGHATVAVIDTGINSAHTMFAGRTISSASRNLVDNSTDISDNSGHGSHVAGIIADATPSQVDLLILRVFTAKGQSTSAIVQAAVAYAVEKNADVINLSLGDTDYTSAKSDWLAGYIDAAWNKGIPIVCAAGNSRKDVSSCYPACNEKTIAVSAINKSGQFAANFNSKEGSNYGSGIDFAAPGVAVESASNRNNYELNSKSGTSMAAPYVTAAAAYIKLAAPEMSVPKIKQMLISYAEDYGTPGKDAYYGYGVIKLADLKIALEQNAVLTVKQPVMTFEGTPCTPGVSVSKIPASEYVVTYKNNDTPGTGTVIVTGKGLYTGSLTATFKIQMRSPVMQGVENKTGGLGVSWNNVPGAEYYGIYKKTGNGSFTLADTVSASKLTWTDKKVTAGKAYTYRIKAINGSITSGYSAQLTAAYVGTAKISSISVGNKGITLKWKKTSGVSGYYVYRRTEGQPIWKYLKKINSAKTVTYADTKCTTGTGYDYKVVPYRIISRKTYVGDAANIKSILYLKKMSTPSVRNVKGRKAQVFWKQAKRAEGYQIRYATKKSMAGAKTVRISSGTIRTTVLSGLKKNKTYYVQIRAIRHGEKMTGYSAWSAAKSIRIKK